MPEPITPEEKKEEKKDKPLGVEVREKSFQQILKEQQEERAKAVEEPQEEEKVDDKSEKTPEVDTKAQEEEARKKEEEARQAEAARQAEIAKKAADEVVRKQEEERQKELDKVKTEEEAKKRQEELKPKWLTDPNAPKDQNGNPVPRTYEEIVAETERITREKLLAELEEKERVKQAEGERIAAEKAKTEEEQKAFQKAQEDQLQKEIDADLNDLYASGKLPKIKDPKDENDPGNKEFRNLFETAQKVNAERLAKGEAPIRSIKLIYYEHYKPLAKLAGHDAPVMGKESTISNEPPEDKYIVSRDRNKSITQLVREEAQRLQRKMGVRGK